ncbi:MAG: PD-(D/E)XK nuclease family protein [Candidatus Wallbacteria bacterium]|nr:PD-(D/E)XK nuclease family protein [Candidatus Wallbacteria bacterium]
MLKVHFSMHFGGRTWPGPAADGPEFGVARVGMGGLLGLLETKLGLSGEYQPDLLRAAALVSNLGKDAFYSASAEVDRLGTARHLLRIRDFLMLHGWKGEQAGKRLSELRDVCHDLPLGTPDRLNAVLDRMRVLNSGISEILCYDPVEHLPALWKKTFECLKDHGTIITSVEYTQVKSSGDLGLVKSRKDGIVKDGTIQLLRCSLSQAADHVAAFISTLPEGETCLIITPDDILDSSLAGFGLPVSGVNAEADDDPLTSILPLVFQLAESPPEPRRVMEFLALPDAPLHPGLRHKLADAMQKWPAAGSPEWEVAVQNGLDMISSKKGSDRAEQQKHILRSIFLAGAEGGNFSAVEIKTRCSLVREWAKDRSHSVPDTRYFRVINQCDYLEDLAELTGSKSFSQPELVKLLSWSRAMLDKPSARLAQAGLEWISEPGAMMAPADNIVWWNFSADAVRKPFDAGLTEQELDDLTKAGVHIPQPAEIAGQDGDSWHLPIDLCRKRLFFVCPLRDRAGEVTSHHPLWDMLGIKHIELETLTVERPLLASKAGMTKADLRPLPEAIRTFRPGIEIKPREHDSPDSISRLIQCPMKWVLEYKAGLSAGIGTGLPDFAIVQGNLAHHLIEKCLQSVVKPAQAERTAEQIFDKEAPFLVAELFLKGNESLLTATRRRIARSASVLTDFIAATGLKLKQIEREVSRIIDGINLQGRVDILLGEPEIVIDIKSGKLNFYADHLADGLACQLTAYGKMLEKKGKFPVLGYFSVKDQRLCLNRPGFTGAVHAASPSDDMMWQILSATFHAGLQRLAAGEVIAAGNGTEDEVIEKDRINGNELCLTSQCDYCNFGILCGNSFREAL